MAKESLKETFGFLLSGSRFSSCDEEQGPGYRQAFFRMPSLILRIAEQREIDARGPSATYLCFLIDPENARRWCMFEKVVQVLLGKSIAGSETLDDLAAKVATSIDPILLAIKHGKEVPFQDFSKGQVFGSYLEGGKSDK